MVQLTYYPDANTAAQPRWEPAPEDVHTLRHGYNLADLDRLTRAALKRGWGTGYDNQTRYEVAWSAIVERLYVAPESDPPAPSDLIFAGQDGISRFVTDEMRHNGRAPGDGLTRQRPRFAAFWERRPTSGDPAARVVDRVALWQIWDQLTYTQRLVLSALAAHGDYQTAADALGKTYSTFQSHVHLARKQFFRLWHEHEEPSGVWGADRRAYRRGEGPVKERRLTAADHLRARKGRAKVEVPHGVSRYRNHGCRCLVCTEAIREYNQAKRRASGVDARRIVTPPERAAIAARRAEGIPVAKVATEFVVSHSLVYAVTREARKASA